MKKKRLIAIILSAMLVISSGVFFTGCSSSDNSSPAKTEKATVAAKESEVKYESYSAKLKSGYYTAGIDFPAGEYNITAIKGNGNVISNNSYNGGINALMGVSNDNMYEKEYKNIELPVDTVLQITGVTVEIKCDKADTSNMKQRTNTAKDKYEFSGGNYEAGKDFEAGTYYIKAIKGNGNVSSDNSLSGGINAVMGVNNDDIYEKEYKNVEFDKDTTLSVKNGVTIRLTPSK